MIIFIGHGPWQNSARWRRGDGETQGRPNATAVEPSDGSLTVGDLNALLQAVQRLSDQSADDPAEKAIDHAQEIAFDAFEAPTSRARIALARKALDISPLCSDAYTILALEAAGFDEAVTLSRQAVDAATQALGQERLNQFDGEFWGALETRPYMHALADLAQSLWANDERDEAVSCFEELLRLNPDDNQGVRYLLADALLELGRDATAQALLDRYKEDDSAAWRWSIALLQFRQTGDSPTAHSALAATMTGNPHVAPYLTARRKHPKTRPRLIGFGDASEAQAYVFGASVAWDAAAGAKAWLGSASEPKPPAAARTDRPIDTDAIDQAVLALLYLNLHGDVRAWKSFSWEAMQRLYDRDLISDPATKAKSVAFSGPRLLAAEEAFERLFGAKREPGAGEKGR